MSNLEISILFKKTHIFSFLLSFVNFGNNSDFMMIMTNFIISMNAKDISNKCCWRRPIQYIIKGVTLLLITVQVYLSDSFQKKAGFLIVLLRN